MVAARRTGDGKKDVKPSEQCAGDVSRTATDTGLSRETAEDNALEAARDAAQRACGSKKCDQQGRSCKYVERSTTGSSAPVVPATNPASFTATMTTSGVCACE
jgi:hypothetical protein